MAVGIGKGVSESELESIAGDKNRIIAADSFDDLADQLDSIQEVANSKSYWRLHVKREYDGRNNWVIPSNVQNCLSYKNLNEILKG